MSCLESEVLISSWRRQAATFHLGKWWATLDSHQGSSRGSTSTHGPQALRVAREGVLPVMRDQQGPAKSAGLGCLPVTHGL